MFPSCHMILQNLLLVRMFWLYNFVVEWQIAEFGAKVLLPFNSYIICCAVMLSFVTVSVVWFCGYPLTQCCAGPTLSNSHISSVSAGPNLNNSSQPSVSAGLNPKTHAHVCLVHGCLSIITVAESITNIVNDLRAQLKLSSSSSLPHTSGQKHKCYWYSSACSAYSQL